MVISKKQFEYIQTESKVKDALVTSLVKTITEQNVKLPIKTLEIIEQLYGTKKNDERQKN